MHGVQHSQVVDLLISSEKVGTSIVNCFVRKVALTVLNANTATTLSQGVSALGSQPIIFDKAFATRSERLCDSVTEYVLPVRPQVKGFRLFAIGRRP
jgi:hypothetical protein